MYKGNDVICIGLIAANIPIYPVSKSALETDLSLVKKMDITPGGDALNQAVVLSRLGRKAGLCGKIGPDRFGRFLLEEMAAYNIDISTVIVDKGVSTGSCAVLILEDGSRHFLSFREANEKFSPDEIQKEKIFSARIVSIGSLLANPLFSGDSLAGFLKEAKDRGTITAADTKHDTYSLGWKRIKEAAKYIDYFLPSYDEASYLSGETELRDIAAFFMDAGVKNIVIKLGAQGSYLRSTDLEEIIPTIDAEVIDTTGAGDNFVAGFLHGILHGWDLVECCHFANAVGAISTTKLGAVAAVKNEIQVKEYMLTHSGVRRST